ncbi:MAG: ATP synthase F1 subunit gamma [Bryobacteraceae bacterium]
MPSLIDIRRRIRSVKNTQQITKAMKMVSAAKLRRAQDRVVSARPYASLLRQMLGSVAATAGEAAADPLLASRPEKRVLLVFITGEKGLAGAFNSNLIKGAQRFVADRPGVAVEFVLLGRKGRDFFRKRGVTAVGDPTGMMLAVKYADAASIARAAMDRFRAEEIDAVHAIYNEFRSAVSQKLTVTRVLPAEIPAGGTGGDDLYEQPPAAILGRLLRRYVEVEIYRAMLESAAAEHAARLTAMDAATANASEMIDKLTLYMNRVRQASITKEIIEVVSGAAAAE